MRQNDETLAVSFNTAATAVVQRRVQQNIFARLGVPTGAKIPPESLPFHPQDITAGTENELAVTVAGARGAVDLPQAIAQLPFFAAGGRAAAGLEKWLAENAGGAWEHSWLRIGRNTLGEGAKAVLSLDVNGRRDRADFDHNEQTLRVPASYALKLALADVLGAEQLLPGAALRAGQRSLGCFLNDNTAPEIISTHIVSGKDGEAPGRAVVRGPHRGWEPPVSLGLLWCDLNSIPHTQFHFSNLSHKTVPTPPPRRRNTPRAFLFGSHTPGIVCKFLVDF